jgi:hypothetical protein
MEHGEGPRRVALCAAVVVFIWLATSPAVAGAAEVPSVTYKCTPAPEDCTGWYRSDVKVDWTVIPSDAAVTGCQDKTYAADTAGTNEFCLADDGAATVTVQFKIKVDKTPPVVTGGEAGRFADADGWYNHAVPVAFHGSDLTSGVDSCTATTYSGPDTASATLEGTCMDRAGNVSAPFGYGLKYDETAPSVTGATPERPPDHAGWYTAPVRFALQATDGTSGLADCPAVTYRGPDSAAASLAGVCRDRAGNVASRAFELSFDATSPPVTGLNAEEGDRRVRLRWTAPADARSVEVVRTPGRGEEPSTVVFQGPGKSFVDTEVRNRRRYVYAVRVRDAAGNLGSRTVTAIPHPHLLAPEREAVVEASNPPVLRWTRTLNARYYNVQLFREGRKVLSAWPRQPRLRLRKQWTYGGRRWRFVPGEYRWLVWPGRGARSKADYGERIGQRVFTAVP